MNNTTTENKDITGKINLGSNTWEITLFCRDGFHPHGYEMERNGISATYTTGCLEISTNANGQEIVEGYDGTNSLPLPVALMLAEKGYGFAPFVFPDHAVKKSIFGL
jgi:hypothetical protein